MYVLSSAHVVSFTNKILTFHVHELARTINVYIFMDAAVLYIYRELIDTRVVIDFPDIEVEK